MLSVLSYVFLSLPLRSYVSEFLYGLIYFHMFPYVFISSYVFLWSPMVSYGVLGLPV